MSKLTRAWVLCAAALSAVAQTIDPTVTGQMDFEIEFSRIQQARDRQEAMYEQEESQCYARFAVTDCVHAVRKRRRESMEVLRKQEVVLRQAERQHKAATELQRLKEKTSEERLSQDAAERREALQAHAQREERARQKATQQTQPNSTGEASRPRTLHQARPAAELAQEKKRYQEKQDQAREQRAVWEKKNREKSGARVQPLPPVP